MRNLTTTGFILFISMWLFSCSAITKSQKSAIESFCTTAKTYSDLPKELVNTYGECLYKTEQWRAATDQDQNNMITDLNTASNAYFDRIKFDSELAISYQLLGKYFQALLDLVNADTASSLKSNIGTLGVNVDSAASKLNQVKHFSIPLGFGDLAASLMQFVGKKWIKQQQLKYFQQFVAKGDPLVDSVSRVFNEVVLGILIKGIEKKKNALDTTYKLYLANLDSGDKKTSSFYGSLNPIYLQLKTCLAQSLLLSIMLAESTESLKAAHKEMIAIIQSKQKKFQVRKIAAFNEKVTQLSDLLKQFKPKS
jgi:hypothetical protein